MQIVAIVNPISGAGMRPDAAGRRLGLIREEVERRGLDASMHVTERSGHARELAEAAVASRADLVIVWGGDGTVNEVGSALVGSEVALGLIPAGSGNGLAGALGVPHDPREAIAAALGDRKLRVDVGMAGNRPFFNVAGVGFDAHIARLFNKRPRGQRGWLPYVLIAMREGVSYAARKYRLTLDGDLSAEHRTALVIAFANGREYGMGMRIAPQARLDDGLLDAVLIEDRSVLARFRDVRHLAMGTLHRAPRTIVRALRSATVETDGEIVHHLDGEPAVAYGRLEISIKPASLIVKL